MLSSDELCNTSPDEECLLHFGETSNSSEASSTILDISKVNKMLQKTKHGKTNGDDTSAHKEAVRKTDEDETCVKGIKKESVTRNEQEVAIRLKIGRAMRNKREHEINSGEESGGLDFGHDEEEIGVNKKFKGETLHVKHKTKAGKRYRKSKQLPLEVTPIVMSQSIQNNRHIFQLFYVFESIQYDESTLLSLCRRLCADFQGRGRIYCHDKALSISILLVSCIKESFGTASVEDYLEIEQSITQNFNKYSFPNIFQALLKSQQARLVGGKDERQLLEEALQLVSGVTNCRFVASIFHQAARHEMKSPLWIIERITELIGKALNQTRGDWSSFV